MGHTMLGRARPGALLVALVAIFLSLGMGSAAWADSGNGNGGSGSGGPPGQAASSTANGATSQGTGSAGSSATAPGNSANAPGHAADGPGNSDHGSAAPSQGSAPAASDTSGPGSSDHSQGNASTQGNPSKPQPISNADQNPGGANGKCPGGPYCSTRDGSPSLNGNGKGNAWGKPCAGCVGKADNKNPKGQYPNGKKDGNNGYECDGNNGIGKTNPAHTGCQAVPPAPKPKPPAPKPKPPAPKPKPPAPKPKPPAPKPKPPAPKPKPPAPKPPAPKPKPQIKGEQHFRPRPNAQVSQVLPSTGADANLGLYGVAGLGLIGLGSGLLGLRRRTTRR